MSDDRQLGTWLDQRLSMVDADLAARISSAVPNNIRDIPTAAAAEVFGGIAADRLRALLANGCEGRDSAPDLLVVDALVTYACEVAAETSADLATADLTTADLADAADAIMRQVTSVLQSSSATA